MKDIMLLDVPKLLRLQGDGTVAREVVKKEPFLCPRCNGSGKVVVEDPHTGQLVMEQCDICMGYGELSAEVTIAWKPCIRRCEKDKDYE
ncbi:MAG: hypothetical protein K6E86_02185 [Bacteroidales bacterium]|nr:hypothetical protein [Bacteroidales bacterium]